MILTRHHPPVGYTSITDFIKEWEQDDAMRIEMEQARQWVANILYHDDGDTIRTLRLRKGWSLTSMAKAIGISESHAARIERGTENLTIETCRKLSEILGIDLNTLDQALKRQEAIAQARLQ